MQLQDVLEYFPYIITGKPTHSAEASLVTVTGVCRLLSSSLVVCNTRNVTHQGQHAAGQSCYVPLGRHLVAVWFTEHFAKYQEWANVDHKLGIQGSKRSQLKGLCPLIPRPGSCFWTPGSSVLTPSLHTLASRSPCKPQKL